MSIIKSLGAVTLLVSASFQDMLLEMIGHAKPGIVFITTKIATKLLLVVRMRNPVLIAHHLLVYFDATLAVSVAEDYEEEGPDLVHKLNILSLES